MSHIMIDIETLDTSPSAVILSIGACVFDPFAGRDQPIIDTFYERASLESQIPARTISSSTLLWWLRQSEEVRNEAFGGTPKLWETLWKLVAWIGGRDEGGPEDLPAWNAYLWSKSPQFDLAILDDAISRSRGTDFRWRDFRNDRDVRTVLALADALGIPTRAPEPSKGSLHNALWDAEYQARQVAGVMTELEGRLVKDTTPWE